MWSWRHSKIKQSIANSNQVAEASIRNSTRPLGKSALTHYFLYKNRRWQYVFELMMAALVLALVLCLAESQSWENLTALRLLQYGTFMTWVVLVFAATIEYLSRWLGRLQSLPRLLLGFMLLQLVVSVTTVLVNILRFWIDPKLNGSMTTAQLFEALSLNLSYGVLMGAFCLRYLYVREQWMQQQHSELLARIQAMQARIHPHFLFNSLNSVVSLISIDPIKAENMLINLSRLFRASFRPLKLVAMAEEIELCKRYLSIEEIRLGARLKVDWRIQATPEQLDCAQIPLLTLQPLLENSIFHGAEQIVGTAQISILVEILQNQVSIVITNPYGHDKINLREGHGIAIDNVKQRLRAYFGQSLKFQTYGGSGLYTTVLRYQSP